MLVAFAVVVNFVSCNKEQPTDGENPPEDVIITPGETVPFTFLANYPVPTEDTRTDIANDGKVSWEAGDVVTLYYVEGGFPASTPATAIAGGASAEFSASIPSGVTEIWAAYPAGSGEIDANGVFTMNIAGPFDGSFPAANLAAAHAEVGPDVVLQFKNAVGLFKIQLPSGGILSHNGDDYTIGSVLIAGKNEEPAFLGVTTVSLDGEGGLVFSAPATPVTQIEAVLNASTRAQGAIYLPSLPFSSTDGLSFRFIDADGKSIPAAITKDNKAITLERGHLKPVNTAFDSIIWDWYFAPDGTGDGKSATAPGNVEAFQNLVNASSATYGQWRLDGATLHLASGTYTLTEQVVIQSDNAVDVVIEGESKSGSILDGTTVGESNKPMIKMTGAVNLNIKNLTLQNGKAGEQGAALQYTAEATGDLSLGNILFTQNQCTLAAGALLLKGTGFADIRDCDFTNNTSSRQGGALIITSTSEVAFTNCSFVSNTSSLAAGGGGAIYMGAASTVRIDNCSFEQNSAVTNGGAIHASSPNSKLFINRTSFESNVLNPTGNAEAGAAVLTAGDVGFYNCTFHYNHGANKLTTALTATKFILANCTFKESVAYAQGVFSCKSTADDLATLCNNVIINNQEYSAFYASEATNYVTSGYNVLTLVSGKATKVKEDATTYIPADKTGRNSLRSLFPTIDSNNRYYVWDGDVSGFDSYAKPTLAQVETLIKTQANIGNEFWEWLSGIDVNGTPATKVDIRGIPRDITTVWPGSYQQDQQD